MAFYDFPYDQLVSYKPPRNEPADFDAFWRDTLAESGTHAFDCPHAPAGITPGPTAAPAPPPERFKRTHADASSAASASITSLL